MNLTSLLEPQLRAMGRRLREQRLAQDINPRALETDLRTTHRHLLAIEEGQTRLFYSDSFFCDLFTRYALALGFSAQEAQDMVATLRTPIPSTPPPAPSTSPEAASLSPAPAPAAGSESGTPGASALVDDSASPELASDETSNATFDATPVSLPETAPDSATPASELSPETGSEAQSVGGQEQLPLADAFPPSEPVAATVAVTAAVTTLQTGSAEQEARAPVYAQASEIRSKGTTRGASKKTSLPTLFFVFLVASVLVFWLVSQQEEEPKTAPSVSAAPERFDKSEASEKPAASAPSGSNGVSSLTGPPAVGAGAVSGNAPAAGALASPIGQTEDPSLKTAASPAAVPTSANTSVANAPEGAPELELVFRIRGWVWVREANDSVREFVVSEGGVVRFQEIPIFIVLPAPDQIDAKVFGRSVSLKRTEEEKNHGRYTRTMLRQAANLGRLPPPPAN